MAFRPGPDFQPAMCMVSITNRLAGTVLPLVFIPHECCSYCGESGLHMESIHFSSEWYSYMQQQMQSVFNAVRSSDYCKSHRIPVESFFIRFEPDALRRIELVVNDVPVQWPPLHLLPQEV